MKRTYTVSVAVNGRFYVDVPVPDDRDEKDAVSYAIDKANCVVSEANFGSLADIDWDVCHIQDEKGNFVYPGQR